MISLYIHIPFCKKKCDYCTFYSVSDDYKEEYTDAIIRCVKKHGGKTLKSIYIGGGTPSVLSPLQISRITDALYKYNTVKSGAEFTVECNPESISADFVKASGANRISMGFQSFSDDELGRIGRLHTADDCERAVDICRACGIDNISGDIIFALPDQSLKSLKSNIKRMVGLGIPHISAYNLQLEEGAPICRLAHLVPDEDTQAKMYYLICEMLNGEGYGHYEVSNFAKDGFTARHNSAYWDGSDYLGLGPAAHSKLGDTRCFFDADVKKFINGDFEFDGSEKITDPLFEKIMLSLRTSRGLSLKYLKNSDQFIKNLINEDFAKIDNGNVVLTDKGFYLSNSIIAELTAREC